MRGRRAYESSFTTAVVEEGDSDDDDLSKMDMVTKARKRIKPWHFESDAAWNKFNDTLEATPKYSSSPIVMMMVVQVRC